jgi:DNA-binding GntR family transcriptional regulator
MADLEDVTNTRVMLETEALRQSIRHGDAQWEAALVQSYELLTATERDLAETGSVRWERRNKAFHEALIAGFNSTWSKYLLSILYRHAERYRHINFRLTAAHASGRDVHKEHEAIFRAAVDRQEARAALALEAHIRLTHDIVRLQASQVALK